MVKLSEERVSLVFKALADPTRRRILSAVARKDATAGELASPFQISAPAISKHLKVLESANLVSRLREGQTHRFHLNVSALNSAAETIRTLTGYWNKRLDNLETYITSKRKGKHHERK